MMSNVFSGGSDVRSALTQTRYVLPAYQRPYSWTWKNKQGKRLVEGPARNLLEDLLSAYNDRSMGVTDLAHGYFLQTIAFWEDGRRRPRARVLVDGQQRITTLWLFASVAWSVMREWGEQTAYDFRQLLVERDDFDGTVRTRIEATGRREVQALMDMLAIQGEDPPEEMRLKGQAQNMLRTWRSMRRWVVDNFQTEHEDGVRTRGQAFMSFFDFVMRDALVMCCSLPSEQMAMEYFRTANGRGLPMSEPNHIKCMFYKNLSSEDTDRMDGVWDEVTVNVQEAYETRGGSGDHLERFLGYHLMVFGGGQARKAGAPAAPALKLYGRRSAGALRLSVKEMMEDGGQGGSPRRLLAAAQEISRSSRFFRNIVKGLSPKGNPSPSTATFPLLNPNMSIHLIALLAASRLDEGAYEEVARALCDWYIVASVAGNHRGSNEATCLKVARTLRDGDWRREGVDRVLALLCEEKRKASRRFREALSSQPVKLTKKDKRTRLLVFGAIDEHLRALNGHHQGFKRTDYLPRLNKDGTENKATRNDYQLEHIEPQALCRGGPMQACVHAIGNQLVLPASVNASLQALPYLHPDKMKAYGKAHASSIVSGLMVDDDEPRGNSRHVEVIRRARALGLGPYTKEWGPEQVAARTRGIVDMACEAFGVPDAEDEEEAWPDALAGKAA